MALLYLHNEGASRVVALPASVIVGRAPACAVRIPDSALPLHWLELRWSAGQWRWRTLAGEARTRGVGAVQEDGWRTLPESSPGRPLRLRYGDSLWVELVEGGAPLAMLLDLQSGETLTGVAMDAVVETTPLGLVPLDEPAQRPLVDGDVVIHLGRAWRLHLAESPAPTWGGGIDLNRPGAVLEIVDPASRALLHQGGREVALVGEHVRVLAVYEAARRADPEEGWLTIGEAWGRWLAMGGNPDSAVERLAWDRARCRSHLARQGVAGLEQLFVTRRTGGQIQYRLGLDPR